MTTVCITDAYCCLDAVQWCLSNLVPDHWRMDIDWPAERYNFSFTQEKDAILFSLKWSCA